MQDLNSVNENQVVLLEKSLGRKLIKRISPERELNIRYRNEKLEVKSNIQ